MQDTVGSKGGREKIVRRARIHEPTIVKKKKNQEKDSSVNLPEIHQQAAGTQVRGAENRALIQKPKWHTLASWDIELSW